MVKPYVLWPALAGVVVLVAALVVARRRLARGSLADRLIALGPAFVASPLAAFGAEHMVVAQFIQDQIPAWMPARLFWAYFVGLALFAAAVSLTTGRKLGLSTALLGAMWVLFVILMHLPNCFAHPGDRFGWAIALRDLAFAGGVLAFAAARLPSRYGDARRLVAIARLMAALPAVYFAIGQILHPSFALGIPLGMQTPPWYPAGAWLGYPVGLALLGLTAAIAANVRARSAAVAQGALLTLVTLVVYVPILAAAREAPAVFEAMNYVFDTLLYGGTSLLLATALQDHAGR